MLAEAGGIGGMADIDGGPVGTGAAGEAGAGPFNAANS